LILRLRMRAGTAVRCALAVVAATALVAGCADDDEPTGSLPTFSQTPSASASAAADSETADKAAIERTYRAYQSAFERAAAAGDVNRRPLEKYGTPEIAQRGVEAIALLSDQDLRQVGHLGIEVRSIDVSGDKAVMTACLDQSKIVTVKPGKKPSPQGTGLGRGLGRMEFVRQQGTWLFSDSTSAGTC
jgi:hypothetical protein